MVMKDKKEIVSPEVKKLMEEGIPLHKAVSIAGMKDKPLMKKKNDKKK